MPNVHKKSRLANTDSGHITEENTSRESGKGIPYRKLKSPTQCCETISEDPGARNPRARVCGGLGHQWVAILPGGSHESGYPTLLTSS
ncbi:hypothetical protein HNR44_000561 [Geomicrobium halophilum]|uniref:Uncharacterized protein n=1 Tax=Geomicrobium halophilum TaxID=549000 RepID=A0A841PX20_9BACL|nr:hypothetical protein [Geomicrobium halophilum]MBB6448612.1 hypothetical protein [Geomicrobium halophilum]